MHHDVYLQQTKQQVESFIDTCLPKDESLAQILFEAMRYSALGGGKRIRGILAVAICRILGGTDNNSLPIASAIELIHSYSLVHDDLPALDNDDYRRGKPTTHKKYGEAFAILAGDALLTHAFWIIANKTNDKSIVADLVENLAWYAGIGGMVTGQTVDMLHENSKNPSIEILDFIHINKTGALIKVACKCGAIAAKASNMDIQNCAEYGEKIGLAFQIIDDILDITGTTENLGKTAGKDSQQGKTTYPSIFGIEKSTKMAEKLIEDSCKAIANIENHQFLLYLAQYITKRHN